MMRFKKRRNKCMIVTNSYFSGSGFLKRQRSTCQKKDCKTRCHLFMYSRQI